MKFKFLWIVLFGFVSSINAQNINEYEKTDKLALQIPDSSINSSVSIADYIKSNFKTDSDKTRAVFAWITHTIQYDIENMYAINNYESLDEIINKVIKSHKGICMDYAALFNDILNKTGVKSYMISGYTRQNESVSYLSHAWCAALIDTSWLLFDPTWGAGYIKNSKFIRQINNSYFKTKPEKLIRTHMPFDPLWQFLNYPVTSQEFYEEKFQQNNKKTYFNYKDSLIKFEKESEVEKLISSNARIESNGVKNSLLFDKLRHNKREIEYYNNSQVVDQYNLAVKFYNESIHLLEKFIDYRNHQFKPLKTDNEIREMADTIQRLLIASESYLESITNPDKNTKNSIFQLNKSIDEVKLKLIDQKLFLKKYFSKPKSLRKSMFYKSF